MWHLKKWKGRVGRAGWKLHRLRLSSSLSDVQSRWMCATLKERHATNTDNFSKLAPSSSCTASKKWTYLVQENSPQSKLQQNNPESEVLKIIIMSEWIIMLSYTIQDMYILPLRSPHTRQLKDRLSNTDTLLSQADGYGLHSTAGLLWYPGIRRSIHLKTPRCLCIPERRDSGR